MEYIIASAIIAILMGSAYLELGKSGSRAMVANINLLLSFLMSLGVALLAVM